MVRIKTAVASRRRKKRTMKAAKGYFGRRSTNYTQAIRTIIRGLQFSYRDRKVRQRQIRSLWIVRINAACRAADISYSRFMNGLKKANVEINRKVLADLAVNAPDAFTKLIILAKDQGK